MNKKTTIIGLIWLAVLSFIVMNFNIYLLIGLIVGIFYRLYHGSVIPLSLGLTIGILLVELLKFINYKL